MAFGESSGFERSEQPTPKRQEDARRKGQVARSTDLTTALLLLGALGALSVAGGPFIVSAVAMFQQALRTASRPDLGPDGGLALLSQTAVGLARRGWPFLVIPAVTAVAAQVLQTRMAVSWEALGPHWNRLNPAQGLARLCSSHGLVEALRTAMKVVVLGGIVYATFRADWSALLTLGQSGTEEAVGTIGRAVRDLWLAVGLSYLAIAGLDYAYQLWHHQRSLRMTRQEVREESRESEGNPLLKSRVRALQRQRATRRMIAEVKRADVVLRNPVHVAVALRYEGGRMRAPRVVAKGARLLAGRIVETARRYGVPIVENPPLARSLFRGVAVGQEIPRDLYRAVAEVLAYVYSLKRPGR
jgi:flagellar biosynthetic protein FlhB